MTESNWRIVELADGDDILITHDELEGRIKKLAGLLSEKGIKPGDRICQYMDNCAEVIVLRQACKRVGAYIIAINFHFSAEEAGYIIRDCGARALFIHKKYAQVCSRAIQGIYTLGASGALGDRLFSVGGATGEFSSYEQAVKDARVFNETHRNIQTPGISYTAGTTGQPKGVIRKQDSEGDFKKKLEHYRSLFDLGDRPVHLVTGPLTHGSPRAWADRIFAMDGNLVIMPRFDSETLLRVVERYRITHMHMVPVMMHRLLRLPEEIKKQYDLSSLRSVSHTAAPCPPETKRLMIEWWGPKILEYYASAEAGMVTLINSQDALKHPLSVGRTVEGIDVKILDSEGKDLPFGQVGDIYVTSRAIQNFEYHNAPDKLKKTKRGDYFTNGDMGYFDEEGYLYLCDRRADLIISGGVNIYPAEIEAAMYSHPVIKDCAVFGIPNKEWGEQVHAHVLTIDDSSLTEDELKAWLRDRIAGYKIPRGIRFVDSLPRQSSGKILKREIRDPYWVDQKKSI